MLHCLICSAAEVPLVPATFPQSCGIAGCAHRGQGTFPLSSCTLVGTKGVRCCLGVNIAFIEVSHWTLRGVCHFCILQLVPGAVCGFRGLPALSTPRGAVSCVAAHTLEKLAALIWLLGSVSPCKPCSAGCSVWCAGLKGLSFPRRRKVWWLHFWDLRYLVLRYSLTRVLTKSHTCLVPVLQPRQSKAFLEKNRGV